MIIADIGEIEEEEIEIQSKTECKKLLNSDKGYNGISFQEFWAEGAKWGIANAIEWHDLRKDPNDLPKLADKRFPWSITVVNQDGEACEYNYRCSRWQNCLASEIDVPIAWCELPIFKDKE